MTKFEKMLQEFPEGAQEMIRQIWTELSEAQREEFERVVSLLPESLKPLKDILALIVDQYRPAFGNKCRIAIVGPANVGKSTLYNQLVLRPEDEAAISPVPGTTRQNQEADTGLFVLVDTPGADAVDAVGDQEREIAFRAARQADFLVIMFESTRGVKRYERDLFEALLDLEKPYLVVLNKMDLIAKADRPKVLASAAHNLRLGQNQLIETVATEGKNVGRVILAVAKAEPELLAAISKAMPEYQARLAWQRILPAASLAGTVGLTPLPFVDLIPLLGIQAGLVLSIARIYGYRLSPGRARELIATFGVGMMARTIFQELSKLGGLPGWILSAAIAASTTAAMGYASVLWFAYGEKPTQAMLKRLAAEITVSLKEHLADFGQAQPDQETLRDRISHRLHILSDRLRPNQLRANGQVD